MRRSRHIEPGVYKYYTLRSLGNSYVLDPRDLDVYEIQNWSRYVVDGGSVPAAFDSPSRHKGMGYAEGHGGRHVGGPVGQHYSHT